jgi:hypothetical protein
VKKPQGKTGKQKRPKKKKHRENAAILPMVVQGTGSKG